VCVELSYKDSPTEPEIRENTHFDPQCGTRQSLCDYTRGRQVTVLALARELTSTHCLHSRLQRMTYRDYQADWDLSLTVIKYFWACHPTYLGSC